MSEQKPERKLTSVPNTGQDYDPARPAPSRRQLRAVTMIAPLVLAMAFAGKPAERAVTGAFDGIKSFLATDSNPKGLSVEQLRRSPLEITITPTQAQAVKGPSELGELVDPGVYQGTHANATTAHNLNTEIGSQYPGGNYYTLRANVPYRVPSLTEGANETH